MPLSTPSANLQHLFGLLSQQTASALGEFLKSSFDKERLQHYLNGFQSRYPHLLDAFAQEQGGRRLNWLLAIFSSSRFLSEDLLQHPEWLDDLPDLRSTLSTGQYAARLSAYLGRIGLPAPRAFDLASFRRREILRIVLRDVSGVAAVAEITEELSNLADAILQETLREIVSSLAQRYGHPSDANPPGNPAAFAVIALGKLGGRELNYSSDIDLMFLYRANGDTTGPDVVTNREFYKKLANRYTELLSTYTPEGLCYRVDLRLRPEGKLGEVCISLDGSRQYYKHRARDWELQMLIKARAVAGDRGLAAELLQSVESSIYSTSTDFSTVETMSATRERLTEKLSAKRLVASDLDIKLTRGGIRDIEFLVQCLQRLHGGRDECVRHGGTIYALSRLLSRDLISATEYSRLFQAYEFFRHLEHRLQFEDDRQTHTLPSGAGELDRLSMRMPPSFLPAPGPNPGAALLRRLNHHLENVQTIYVRIVHAQRPLSYGALVPVPSQDERPHRIQSGEVAPGISHPREVDGLLAPVESEAPLLAESLRRTASSPTRLTLDRLDGFLAAAQHWLPWLNARPAVVRYLLEILRQSPYLTDELVRNMSLLSEIESVADQPNRRSAFEGLASPLNDITALRRFFHRELFRIQTASICVPEPVFQTLDRTSALAEFMIARAYRIALERSLAYARRDTAGGRTFAEPGNEMMVVALGRLGMREFDLGSDADLLFIIPDSESIRQKFWTRVAGQMIDILTAYSTDGVVLSIDTRLRPNGREGLLVQPESAFNEYFAHHSEAWEGIAYMKARAVAGDSDRATAFLAELQEIDWRRWGQSGRSRQDLKQMRLRLEKEQGGDNLLKAGRGGYYDADFALMYLRLKGAGLFFKSLNTPERIDIVEKMGHLERGEAEFLLRATTFYRALDHGIRVSRGHAEGKLPNTALELELLTGLVDRWTPEYPRSGSLVEELSAMRNSMRELFDRLFR